MKIESIKSTSPQWLEHYRSGMLAMNRGNFKKAKDQLHAAAEISLNAESTEIVAYSFMALSEAYRATNQFDQATSILLEATRVSFADKDSPIIHAFCLCALGSNLMDEDQMSEGTYILQKGVNKLRRFRREAEPRFIMAFIILITSYLIQETFGKADDLCRYSYNVSKDVLGPTDKATLIILILGAACAEAFNNEKRKTKLINQVTTLMKTHPADQITDALGLSNLFSGITSCFEEFSSSSNVMHTAKHINLLKYPSTNN